MALHEDDVPSYKEFKAGFRHKHVKGKDRTTAQKIIKIRDAAVQAAEPKDREDLPMLQALQGESCIVSARLIVGGKSIPVPDPDVTKRAMKLDVSIYSLQVGPTLRINFGLWRADKNKFIHRGCAEFPIGQLQVMDDRQGKVFVSKSAIHDLSISYPNPKDKSKAILSFTSDYAVAKGLRPSSVNFIQHLLPHEEFVVKHLEQFCHISGGQSVKLALRCKPSGPGQPPNPIETLEKKLADLKPIFDKHWMFQYRQTSNDVKALSAPLEMSSIIDRGNEWIHVPATFQFAGPSHAEIVLGYGIHFSALETQHVYTELARKEQRVAIFTIGPNTVLALEWKEAPAYGIANDVHTLQEGDELKVKIKAGSALGTLELRTRVFGNVFGGRADAFLLADESVPERFSSLTVDYNDFLVHKYTQYPAHLIGRPNEVVTSALASAVSKAYDPHQSDGTHGRLLPMLLSQAHDAKTTTKHPLASVLDKDELDKFNSEFELFTTGDDPSFTPSQQEACKSLLAPENDMVLIDGMGGSGKTFWMHQTINFITTRSKAPVKVVVSSQNNGVLDMNAVELDKAFGDHLKVIRAAPSSATSMHNIRTDNAPKSSTVSTSGAGDFAMLNVIDSLRKTANKRRAVTDLSVEGYVFATLRHPDQPSVWGRLSEGEDEEDEDVAAYFRKWLPRVLQGPNTTAVPASDAQESDVSSPDVSKDQQSQASATADDEQSEDGKDATQIREEEFDEVKMLRAFQVLCKHEVKTSDVVVGTPYALHSELYSSFASEDKGVMLFVDESPNVCEAAVLIVHTLPAWSKKILVTILLGDMLQLGPLGLSIGCNQFLAQMSVSMHQRLLSNGYSVTLSREQKRIHDTIFSVVNKMFYNSRYDSTGTHPDLPAGFQELWLDCLRLFDKQRQPNRLDNDHGRLAWFEVSGEWRQSSQTKSSANLENLIVGRHLIAQLSKYYGESTQEKVALIVPYKRQKELYKGIIAGMMHEREDRPSFSHFPDIWTVDRAQGDQKEVVVLDLVVTNRRNQGFLKDKRRLTVATTRGKQVLWIIGGPFAEGDLDEDTYIEKSLPLTPQPRMNLKLLKEEIGDERVYRMGVAKVTDIPWDLQHKVKHHSTHLKKG